MTEDVKSLVERLKDAKGQCIDCRMEETAVDFGDAIDALEQQAARIAELERDIKLQKYIVKDLQALHVAGFCQMQTILGAEDTGEYRWKWLTMEALEVVEERDKLRAAIAAQAGSKEGEC